MVFGTEITSSLKVRRANPVVGDMHVYGGRRGPNSRGAGSLLAAASAQAAQTVLAVLRLSFKKPALLKYNSQTIQFTHQVHKPALFGAFTDVCCRHNSLSWNIFIPLTGNPVPLSYWPPSFCTPALESTRLLSVRMGFRAPYSHTGRIGGPCGLLRWLLSPSVFSGFIHVSALCPFLRFH